ncbi:alpha-mannosidase [Cohnella silvisoli]|uniref:Glycoside hydrolase family 38 C-terminal domain-containing protein n=1 Tax=Cohnella silvisoli TaxID=2873699 RepID=A0ABV1L3Q1_9BACL|nr:alpha-mannosidase [Cohnella silvisoli]MCD9025790.1 alpha-mannosidase [Cohnella silvisoli]
MRKFESVLADMNKTQPKHYWSERILSELGYAAKLSEIHNGKFDGLLTEAVNDLADEVEKQGVITKEIALETEIRLTELSAEAKRYRMLCAGHAHIDMNWMWGWDETVSITLDTFRTVLELMRRYPDFRFSQSQAVIYKIVDDHAPEMLEEIKSRIKEGRWEVTASHWVEADKNMPNGESLSRHLLYTKRYLSELLELDPASFDLDFEPDTFGHSINVPEILTDGGVKYYYHCRGDEGHQLYRWIAPSGRAVTAYREPVWYNGEITPQMAWYVPEFCDRHGIDTMLRVYGVGDHGGGPTRRDIERIMDMSNWPIYPTVAFGTFREFFRLTDSIINRLPEVTGERNFVFTGCYTSQSRIKMANRLGEAALNEAEAFGTFAALKTDFTYRNTVLSEAWKNVLFNQFHDILPGSGVVATREHAMGLFQNTIASANSVRKLAMQGIADLIDTSGYHEGKNDSQDSTSAGAGVGFRADCYRISHVERGSGKTRIFHLFNSASFEREEVTEITIWDWQGDVEAIRVTDDQGESVRYQVVGHGFHHYWGHHYLTVLVHARVPGFGYGTYVLTEGDRKIPTPPYPDPRKEKPSGTYVLENCKIRALFDKHDASLVSLIDKSTGREMIGQSDSRSNAALFRLIQEDTDKEMTAWYVGRYKNVNNLNENVKIRNVTIGPDKIRQSLSYEIPFANSVLKVTVSLDEESHSLNFDLECDWHERGDPDNGIPQLGFHIPLAYECNAFKYDVPYGVIERTPLDMDVPANSWAMGINAESGEASVLLVSDSKYGFRGHDKSLNISLIRSSYDPDPYPELGIHRFRFALCLLKDASNQELIELGYRYNHPLNALSGTSHLGVLPQRDSFFGVEEGTVSITALKMPEDGTTGIIIRYYESEGKEGRAVFRLHGPIAKAELVDVHEQPVLDVNRIQISGNQMIVEVKPYEIACIRVELEGSEDQIE